MQRNAMRPWTLALALASSSTAMWAAEPVTPGSIGDTLKPPPALNAPPPKPQVAAPAQPQHGAGQESGARITVSRFEFVGNSLFSSADLTAVVAGYIGKPISLNELYEAADLVADFYAAHGYTLTNVNVPAQTVKDGVVKLEVLEGRIGSISFEGNRHYSSHRLSSFVTHTRAGGMYRSDDLQKDLLTLNSLPGLSTRAVLRPGSEFGTSDVVIKAQDQLFDATATIDNYGRKDVGEYRYSAQIGANDLLDLADRTQLLLLHSNTSRLNYADLAWSVPLRPNGLRLSADYGYAYFSAEIVPPIESAGHNKNATVSFDMPWIRNYSDTLSSSIGWLYTNANADLTGLSISDTNISLLTLSTSESHAWSNGAVSQAAFGMHTNFESYSSKKPNHEPFRGELNLQHLQPLPYQLQVLANVDMVYSAHKLPDTEEIAIGGPTTIRGFTPSEERGDRGYYGQLTLRRSFLAFDRFSVTPRAFGDTGTVWLLDQPVGAKQRDSLSSAGVGVDVAWRMVTFRVDWAMPLDSKPVADGRDDYGRFYGSLSASF